MSDFAPRSLGMGHLLFGIGVFIVAAVVGLKWIEGGFVSDTHAERSEKGLGYLLADTNRRIVDTKMKLETAEGVSRQFDQKNERLEVEREILNKTEVVTVDLVRLRALVVELDQELQETVKERASYQRDLRDQLWRSVVGRELDESSLLRKLPYEEMVINEVDAAGLMVRHRAGVARVLVRDLTPAFREELDLHRDEGEKVLREILARDSRAKESGGTGAGQAAEVPVNSGKIDRLVEARTRVSQLERLIGQTMGQAIEARRNDLQSNNRSAPGSLETWGQRAKRLEGQALKYRNQLAELKLALRQLQSE